MVVHGPKKTIKKIWKKNSLFRGLCGNRSLQKCVTRRPESSNLYALNCCLLRLGTTIFKFVITYDVLKVGNSFCSLKFCELCILKVVIQIYLNLQNEFHISSMICAIFWNRHKDTLYPLQNVSNYPQKRRFIAELRKKRWFYRVL